MKSYVAVLFCIVAVLLTGCSAPSPAGAAATAAADPGVARKDSVARAKKLQDSLHIAELLAVARYPYIKGGKWSGVIPVDNPTEVPDPNRDYKLLFDITEKNPDSLSREINSGLEEVARILNLHVASGIPPGKLIPVIIIHGPGIEAVKTNESYRKRHAVDNPNLNLVHDLEKAGAKIIVCGQAMAFFRATKEDLLPDVKISLTAQTVLSNYQLQGYVHYPIKANQ